MQDELSNFIIYISSEKGLSKNTIEAYKRDLEHFFKFLKELGVFQISAVDKTHIFAFIGKKKEENYAPSSLCRNLIAIKVLFRFLKREGIIDNNVALYLESPKLWNLIPEVLTGEEIDKLLILPDVETKMGARDRAILEVLYASGLRVSELCALKIQDLDDEYVRVYGKGGKERIVPIGKKAITAVDYYLSFRDGLQTSRQETLFLTNRNQPMNRIAVWNLVKTYVKKAGIEKNISPHTFRHSFATHLLDHGADLRVIQELLGHSSITSTDRYTQISRTQIQKKFQEFHTRF